MSEFGPFLADIEQKSRSDQFRGEAELRQDFLKGLQGLLESKTRGKVQLRLEESLARGRSDARVAYMVFEFKDPGRLSNPRERRAALDETVQNLQKTASRLGVESSKLRGMLTDGETAQSLGWHAPSSDFVPVDVNGHSVGDPLSFRPLTETAPWLDGSIHALTTRELSPENLLEDFGPGTDLGRNLFRRLWEEFQMTKSGERTGSFYKQWEILFSASTRKVVGGEDIKDQIRAYGIEAAEVRTEEEVHEFLFVLHTFYAVLLKFAAILVADTVELLGPVSLLERIGENPSVEWKQAEEQLPRLAANLIEKDVFSWFELGAGTELTTAFSSVAIRVNAYDATSVRRDVLKRVYQQIIPWRLRKALGEFYTPDWAAELTLDAVQYEGRGKLLDPSCGSGTFLVLAIGRYIDAHPSTDPPELLEQLIQSVVGLDLNPVAVSTARINYLLAVVDVVRSAKIRRGIRIPVYLCNSVVVPSETRLNPKAPVAEVPIWDRTLIVPFSAKNPDATYRVLTILEEHASHGAEDYLNAVRNALGVQYEEEYRPILRELHRFVAGLHARDANGIWARFVENFFAPLFLDKFDYVVGNPPWVAPVHVPKIYRDHVDELMRGSGYQEVYDPRLTKATARFRAGEPAFVSCLPFVPVAFDRYLNPGPNSRIAFLLTSSLARSLGAGGWRESVLLDRLDHVVDLTPITDIHEGADCWAFVPVLKNPPVSQGLLYDYVQRRGARKNKTGAELEPDLVHNEWEIDRSLIPLSRSDKRAPWLVAPPEILSIFRKMVDGHPRIGDVYPMNMGIKTDDNKTFFLRSIDKVDGPIAKVTTLGGESIQVETDLLYPLVTGKNVGAWTTTYEWMILPHDPKTWKPYAETQLERDYPEAFAHFKRHYKALIRRQDYANQRAKKPFFMVFRISSSKLDRDRVAYPLIETTLKASLVPNTVRLPEVPRDRVVLVDHSAYTLDAQPRRAALYLTGLLNSSPYRALAYVLADPKGGVPFKQYVQWTIATLPLLPIGQAGAFSTRVAKLADRRITSPKDMRANGFQEELDMAVGELLGLSDSESKRLGRFIEFATAVKPDWDG